MNVSGRLLPRRLLCAAAWLVFCSAAHAHGAFGESQSLWSGVGHVLVSPLSIAAIVGLALAGAEVADRWLPAAAGLAGAAAALAAVAATGLPPWLAPALVAFVGLAAVGGSCTRPLGVAMLSLCAGTAAGLGAALDEVGLGSLAGVGAGTAVAALLALVWTDNLSRVQRLKPVLPVARRIVGAWVAALGILLCALALRPSGP